MAESIASWLIGDHRRLEGLLARAKQGDREAYEEFRAGLLRHIGIEEKILLPAIAAGQGGRPYEHARQLRLDHGAVAALLVPPPEPVVLEAIERILSRHNLLEEGEQGMYATAERVAPGGCADLLRRARALAPPPPAEHHDGPHVRKAVLRALERAGYQDLELGEWAKCSS